MDDVGQNITAHIKSSGGNIENFVASLAMSRSLDAVLLHSDDGERATMLRFCSSALPPILKERQVQSRLLQGSESLKLVTYNVELGNYGLGLSDEHFIFPQQGQRWPDDGPRGGAIPVNEAAGALDVDEDIMGDIR
ncbi:COP9 signalosome complex subunit 3 [Aspergillus nanangensis]|uniref:COP9 signalosome complex subunit 3 n=1 Tax=Aspergillus nanangensis TaxID=2582783 RepID=A0AAD4CAM3_ASPNN|nr:COP9 signalosome complex subunit 3 [Aspergillus nanangensis]